MQFRFYKRRAVTKFGGSGSTPPLSGTPQVFEQNGNFVEDMEEGGSGEVYVSLPGSTYSIYRFNM